MGFGILFGMGFGISPGQDLGPYWDGIWDPTRIRFRNLLGQDLGSHQDGI